MFMYCPPLKKKIWVTDRLWARRVSSDENCIQRSWPRLLSVTSRIDVLCVAHIQLDVPCAPHCTLVALSLLYSLLQTLLYTYWWLSYSGLEHFKSTYALRASGSSGLCLRDENERERERDRESAYPTGRRSSTWTKNPAHPVAWATSARFEGSTSECIAVLLDL